MKTIENPDFNMNPKCRLTLRHYANGQDSLRSFALNHTTSKGKFFCGIPCRAWICIYVCRFRAMVTPEKVHRAIVF